MIDHVSPDPARLATVANSADGSPVVLLNRNRYRDVAEYGPGHPVGDSAVSGRDAYLEYGGVAAAAIGHVGGTILWAADAGEVVIGCDHDRYDEIVAVWYPSREAFLGLASYPGYMDALAHRDAALEQAMGVVTRGDPEPRLSVSFSRSS
jgi:uncharacterized protein (DUF1330 family)